MNSTADQPIKDPAERIRTRHTVRAAAAFDTIDAICDRVEQLLAAGRRITLVSRHITDGAMPTTVQPGLVPDGPPQRWRDGEFAGIVVTLGPPNCRFGISVGPTSARNTERQVWQRYHAADDSSVFTRRANMTIVEIKGGLPNSGPARDDQLTIQRWNSDGVGTETIVAFDYTAGMPCRDDAVAAWLKQHRDQHRDGQALTGAWYAIDRVLDDYRDHADCGVPLNEPVPGPWSEQ